MCKSLLNRRRLNSMLAVGTASLAAPALLAQPRLERDSLAIAVDGKAAFHHLPLTLAQQLGFFKAEGLDVEISDFKGSARVIQVALDGSADVIGGGYEHTLHLLSRGYAFQGFVLQGRAPQMAMGVSNKTLGDYKSAADLRGKKIGVAAPGSPSDLMAHQVLARAGLKTDDASFIGVGNSTAALAALRSGQIDAISHGEPVMTLLEQKAEIRVIADTRTLKGTLDVFGGPMPSACLYAPIEFVQRYPNTTQALTHAIVHALKWLQTAGPRDIIRAVPESHLLGDRGLYLASFDKVREAISVDGLFPEDGAGTVLRVLRRFDATLKADRMDVTKTFTNQFARVAKERFKA